MLLDCSFLCGGLRLDFLQQSKRCDLMRLLEWLVSGSLSAVFRGRMFHVGSEYWFRNGVRELVTGLQHKTEVSLSPFHLVLGFKLDSSMLCKVLVINFKIIHTSMTVRYLLHKMRKSSNSLCLSSELPVPS